MNFIVRLDSSLPNAVKRTYQVRSYDKDEAAIRRSFNTGELFVNISQEMESLIEEKIVEFRSQKKKILQPDVHLTKKNQQPQTNKKKSEKQCLNFSRYSNQTREEIFLNLPK